MTTKMALAISQRTCMGSSGRTQAVRSLQAFPRRRREPLDLCQKRHTGNRSPLIGNSMKRALRILALAIAMALVAGMPLAVRPVAAHQQVTVGEFVLTVGWKVEPAVAGYVNGLDLGIQHRFSNGTTVWVVGVAGNLTAVLTTGPKSVSKALEPQADRDGWYTFDVIPTRVGTYTVRLQGTLGTTPVDVMVPLDDVSPASDFAFPVADQPASDLQSRLDAANAAIAGLQWQLCVAVALAVLGILMAAAGVMMGRRMSRGPRKEP